MLSSSIFACKYRTEDEPTVQGVPDDAPKKSATIDLKKGHLGITITASAFPTLGGISLSWRHEKDLAAKVGLAAGDLMLSLNKTPVSDHVEALAIINGCSQLKIEWLPRAEAERIAKDYAEVERLAKAAAPATDYIPRGIGRSLLVGALLVYLVASFSYRLDDLVVAVPASGRYDLPNEQWPQWSHGAIESYRDWHTGTPTQPRATSTKRATPAKSSKRVASTPTKRASQQQQQPAAAARKQVADVKVTEGASKGDNDPAAWDEDEYEERLENVEFSLGFLDADELRERIAQNSGGELTREQALRY
eukprot:990931-Prymnesium_polylepis.1